MNGCAVTQPPLAIAWTIGGGAALLIGAFLVLSPHMLRRGPITMEVVGAYITYMGAVATLVGVIASIFPGCAWRATYVALPLIVVVIAALVVGLLVRAHRRVRRGQPPV
ncbi:hypothetical protein GCM10009551_064650 [Nocardiopsis tropica]